MNRVLWDETTGCVLTHWQSDWWDTFYRSGFQPLVQARILGHAPYERINWHLPDTLVDSKQVHFYETLDRFQRHSETSYWIKHGPSTASGFSICSPEAEIDAPQFFTALGIVTHMHNQMRYISRRANHRRVGLTETEEKYLDLLYQGCSKTKISELMQVSSNWVAKTCMNMRRKLGVKSDSAAIGRALDLCLLS